MRITLFKTHVAPMALVESSRGLAAVVIGQSLSQLRLDLQLTYEKIRWAEQSELADAMVDYTRGVPVDWTSVPLDRAALTDFRSRVTTACQQIEYGARSTYRALAAAVGQPHASRAVGRVMATNPWPIIVPCHRVLRADGALGGYSAPTGLTLKQRLLDMEAGAGGSHPVAARQAVFAWAE